MSERAPVEPIVLDDARHGTGRFAALSRSGTDVPMRKAGMRLWAFVTLGLCLAAALVVYVPLVVFCFWRKGDHDQAAAFRELKTIEDFDWQINPSIKEADLRPGHLPLHSRESFCPDPGAAGNRQKPAGPGDWISGDQGWIPRALPIHLRSRP